MGVEYVTNPETGRKIKVGGEAYNKLTHAQQEAALGYGPKPKAKKAPKAKKVAAPKAKKAPKKPKIVETEETVELVKTPIGWADVPSDQVKKFLSGVDTLDYSEVPDYTIFIAYGKPVFDMTASKTKKLKTVFWKEDGMFHVQKKHAQLFELVFGLVSKHISSSYDADEISTAGFEGWLPTSMVGKYFDMKSLEHKESYVEYCLRYGGLLVKVGMVAKEGAFSGQDVRVVV